MHEVVFSQKMNGALEKRNLLLICSKGESSYVCWAFSCATMIRTECRRLVNYLFDNGKINAENKMKSLWYINVFKYSQRKKPLNLTSQKLLKSETLTNRIGQSWTM